MVGEQIRNEVENWRLKEQSRLYNVLSSTDSKNDRKLLEEVDYLNFITHRRLKR